MHPDYISATENGEGKNELAFSIPIARVDSLIGFYDKKYILNFTGVERVAGFSTDVPY